MVNVMEIDIVKVGKLRCNCYILSKNNKVLIIDPGDDIEKIKDKIGNRLLVGIIITHYHFDHIGAMEDLIKEYNVLVYDRYNMNEGINKIDDFLFEVIYTPGHKEDLITIYFKENKVMFCGDFIFKNSIGRCDLDGGDFFEMIKSLKKIFKYDNDIILYPGHGEETILCDEINNNKEIL